LSAGALGLEIAAYVGLGFMGGPWLDGRLGTAPWFKVLGIIVGVGAPINALVRIVRQYNRSLSKDDTSNPDHGRDGRPDV
jgi:ATP synthase protein I